MDNQRGKQMNVLDDLEKIKQIDNLGMLEAAEGFYNQLVHARQIAMHTDISSLQGKDYAGVAFLGMGGSGFSGDIIKDLIKYETDIPIEVVKGYKLPGCVKSSWLTVAFSYSGNTEETIHALETAMDRRSSILCITSGGLTEQIAKSNGYSLVKVPSGYQPRAASAYLFFPAYLILAKLGIIEEKDKEIEECLEMIGEKTADYNRNSRSEANDAKKLAAKIGKSLPIVYGTEGPLASVACRWKCQFNENAKCPSFFNQFPELNHNETVGWQRLRDVSQRFTLILFKDQTQQEPIRKRIEVTKEIIRESFGSVIEIEVQGENLLYRTLSTMYLGDIASVYLAILNDVDPYAIDKINRLKAELAKIKK
jgi:glucose/mannose-6-phosphate isomerase